MTTKKSAKAAAATSSPVRGRPRTGQMPLRNIRIGDELWASVNAAAERAGVATSEWIRGVLSRAAARK